MRQFKIKKGKGHGGKTGLLRMALIFLLCLTVVSGVCAEETLIRILHVNDFHGFAEPHKPFGSEGMVGGAAYLAAAINRLRNERPSLLLAAGDMIQGNTWSNFSKGASVIELMNAMKFDAMVIGNHELDFGQDVLKKRISETTFPVLAANVLGLEEVKPFAIKEVGGIKVGILGVVAEDTPLQQTPLMLLV
jgi:5'-nucleotidase / UDP-sugar diphosphatase